MELIQPKEVAWGSAPLAPGQYRRIEDKFILDKDQLPFLVEQLERHLRPHYPNPKTRFTKIESLYFDGEELDFFKHHISELTKRFKLRLRKYAPNGVWSEECSLLEVKSKTRVLPGQSFGEKVRIKVDEQSIWRLKKAIPLELTTALYDLNLDLEQADLVDRINQINQIIEGFRPTPRISISYTRFAYEGDGVRVTVDKDIDLSISTPLSRAHYDCIQENQGWLNEVEMRSKFNSLYQFVLEIKHRGNIPGWLNRLLQDQNILQSQFSKYCWGISRLLKNKEILLEEGLC